MERFDPVQLYFKEIKNIPLIPKDDMPKIWKKAFAGDKKDPRRDGRSKPKPRDPDRKKIFPSRHRFP